MKWIKCSDKLPKLEDDCERSSVDVLCLLKYGENIITYYNYGSKSWILSKHKRMVTHWMPLPKPPKK